MAVPIPSSLGDVDISISLLGAGVLLYRLVVDNESLVSIRDKDETAFRAVVGSVSVLRFDAGPFHALFRRGLIVSVGSTRSKLGE